ncbi:MAG: hypothetical protein NUW01_06595 [Gemmatimonadaceae bacterium]|nr:hypothetical protein [Gemmatimonadaceae bacterium]
MPERSERTAPVWQGGERTLRSFLRPQGPRLYAKSPKRYDDSIRIQARELVRSGRSVKEAAALLKVNAATVKGWKFKGWR